MNPEWKELVTEFGICKKPVPWEQQVKKVISDIKKDIDNNE